MAELTKRYLVMALATEAPFDLKDPDGSFVLKPWKDPAALRALEAYRDHCYPALAKDLDAWVRAIQGGPIVRGGVGKLNEPHAKSPLAARPAKPAVRAKPKPTARGKAKRR